MRFVICKLHQSFSLVNSSNSQAITCFLPLNLYLSPQSKCYNFMTSEQQLELLAQAEQHLLEGEYEAALTTSQQLAEAGVADAYRIQAQVFAEQEQMDEAVEAIKQGMKLFPDAWDLALFLGNLYGEMGKPDRALRLYDRLNKESDAPKDWIKLHVAAAHAQKQNFDESLNLLQEIEEENVVNHAFELQLNILDGVGRHDMIIELAEEDLEVLRQPESEADAAQLSRIMSQIAQAYWYEEEDEERIIFYLKQAVAFDRTNPGSLYLLREQDVQFSDDAQGYFLYMKGEIELEQEGETSSRKAFTTAYQVIADSEEEALAFIAAFEIPLIDRESLAIVEVETFENEADEPKGIYEVLPLNFATEDMPETEG